MKPEYKPFVDELIELCIREDIGDGDHTSLSCTPAADSLAQNFRALVQQYYTHIEKKSYTAND